MIIDYHEMNAPCFFTSPAHAPVAVLLYITVWVNTEY